MLAQKLWVDMVRTCGDAPRVAGPQQETDLEVLQRMKAPTLNGLLRRARLSYLPQLTTAAPPLLVALLQEIRHQLCNLSTDKEEFFSRRYLLLSRLRALEAYTLCKRPWRSYHDIEQPRDRSHKNSFRFWRTNLELSKSIVT